MLSNNKNTFPKMFFQPVDGYLTLMDQVQH